MSSKSKIKGSGYERVVAKFLSEQYKSSFVRVPGSGAYIGGLNNSRKLYLDENQTKSFKGDIVGPDDWRRFNAECKSYADFPTHQLFHGEVKILEGWIGQCLDVAEPDDFNILFMKFNRKGQWVCVEAKHPLAFDRHFTYTSSKHGQWVLMEFNYFFEKNFAMVEKLCK